MLDYSVSAFHISLGSTSVLSAPLNSAIVSLDKMSEGLLWLGTLSIQTGTSNSLSIWKMMLISLSLSSFADQLLRKEPRTASLSVNRATRCALHDQIFPIPQGSKNRHHFQLLNDSLLTFGHDLIENICVHFHTEK